MDSLYTKNACESLHVITSSTMWNVEGVNYVLNSFALIELDWAFSLGFFPWIKSISTKQMKSVISSKANKISHF